MENILPREWKWVKLGEACEIVSGNTPKGLEQISNKGDFHFYKVGDMNLVGNEVRMSVSNLKLTAEGIRAAGFFEKNKYPAFVKTYLLFSNLIAPNESKNSRSLFQSKDEPCSCKYLCLKI